MEWPMLVHTRADMAYTCCIGRTFAIYNDPSKSRIQSYNGRITWKIEKLIRSIPNNNRKRARQDRRSSASSSKTHLSVCRAAAKPAPAPAPTQHRARVCSSHSPPGIADRECTPTKPEEGTSRQLTSRPLRQNAARAARSKQRAAIAAVAAAI